MAEENTGARGGALKAKPIVIYPQSDEQRATFQEAANTAARGKLSPFMLLAAEQFIDSKKKIVELPKLEGGKKGKTIMVYPDSPEQRERFVDAAKENNMPLGPFMVYVAEQFVSKMKRK